MKSELVRIEKILRWIRERRDGSKLGGKEERIKVRMDIPDIKG